jgi:hypothetical protein
MIYSVKETRVKLGGLTKMTVERMIDLGKLKVIRAHGRVIVLGESVERLRLERKAELKRKLALLR